VTKSVFLRAGLAVLLPWITAASARANIGEDINQLRARYGAFQPVGAQALFQHEGYSICVYFDGEKSAMEVYTPISTDAGGAPMDQDAIDKILAWESDGLKWNPMPVSSGKATWVRADAKIIARLNPSRGGKDDATVLVFMLNSK